LALNGFIGWDLDVGSMPENGDAKATETASKGAGLRDSSDEDEPDDKQEDEDPDYSI